MAITLSKEELDAHPGTKSMCQYGAIYTNGAIVCQHKHVHSPSIVGIMFALAVATMVIAMIVKWVRKQDQSGQHHHYYPHSSAFSIFQNHDSDVEQLNPVPVYTASADPSNDFGFYDPNGNLVALQKPLLTYQRDTPPTSQPPEYAPAVPITNIQPHITPVFNYVEYKQETDTDADTDTDTDTETDSALPLPQQPPKYSKALT